MLVTQLPILTTQSINWKSICTYPTFISEETFFSETATLQETLYLVFFYCHVHGQCVIYYNKRLPGVIFHEKFSVVFYRKICEVDLCCVCYLFLVNSIYFNRKLLIHCVTKPRAPNLLSWRCYTSLYCQYLPQNLLTGHLFVRILHLYQRGLHVSRTTALQETLYLLSLPPPVLYIDSVFSNTTINYQELSSMESILVIYRKLGAVDVCCVYCLLFVYCTHIITCRY